MKHGKKVLAVVLAVMLVLALGANAFAAKTADETVSVTGLAAGDQVTYYKVVEWVDGSGWALTSDFSSLGDAVLNEITSGSLSLATVNQIAALADKATAEAAAETLSGTAWEAKVDAGLYMVLVAPATAGTIYNPIFVASDFDAENGTNVHAVSLEDTYGDSSVAKKSTVTVEKTANDYTSNVGDDVNFTVKTTIPAYTSAYVNPFFNVSDTLSDGLALDAKSIVVKDIDAANYTVTTTANGFTVAFNSDYVASLTAATPVEITYTAKFTNDAAFNVNDETNDVTVQFSNDPTDATGADVVKDATKHYTFSIDANLLGKDGYENSEIVKVGKDKDGNPIYEEITLNNGTKISPLEGAQFALYTDEACTKLYTNDVFNGTVTSDANGKLNIQGLDAGTYYLKETSATAGFIKDNTVHTIVIDATLESQQVNETITVDGKDYDVSYTVDVLTSYTVTIDGKTTSTFTIENDGTVVKSSSAGDETTEIVNTEGTELPSTGGIGTTIFYTLGGILVVAAVILLITKKRMDVKE